MATTKTSQTTQAGRPKLVCCLNCLHAKLRQHGTNPILAACKCKPQPDNERFPYDVQVARPLRNCSDWKLDPNEKEVEHITKAA